jgi:transposase
MKEQMRNDIIRRWHAGTSQRKIAAQLKISRNTVSHAIKVHEQQRAEGVSPVELQPKRSRKSLLDPFEDDIKDLLDRYPDIRSVRVLEELQAKGFTGSYSTVKQRVRALRPRPVAPVVVRFETAPGVQAQMDYSPYDIEFTNEGRRRVHGFSYVLGYSRRQYLRFVEHQDFITTIREHVRAFEHLGGVAAVCLYDQMKVVVNRIEDGEPIYNTRFLAFATHYGFRPWACQAKRPQTKGKVERPFYYVETNLLNGRDFRSLEHLNEVASWWLRERADVRIHRETKRRPIDMHKEELPHLLRLPEKPFDVSEVVYRSVNGEHRVLFRSNEYSVPWQMIGELVVVRATETDLIVYGKDIKKIAHHDLLPRCVTGQTVIDKAHSPSQEHHRRHELLAERFTELGETGLRFLEGLMKSRFGKSEAHKVLSLLATYRKADLHAATERAVRYGAFSFGAIERILSVQAEPRPVMESLAEESHLHLSGLLAEPPVQPRSPAEYRDLVDEDPEEDSHGTS